MVTSLIAKKNRISIGSIVSLVLVLAVVGAISGGIGAMLGYERGLDEASPEMLTKLELLQQNLNEDRQAVMKAQARAEDELDALAARLGSIQAQVMRLEAVGEHLVGVADLDESEFIFGQEPGIGGLDNGSDGESESGIRLLAELDNFEALLKQQEYQLTLLEEVLMNKDVLREIMPSGLPVNKGGWISSGFGSRIHPISGKRKMHLGVDFPGRRGTEILAVAPGVVTKSKYVSGYGYMIEIRHADGYLTRYAHNSKLLVGEGDLIEKGEKIALMGSTGSATGTHLHFEVRKDGVAVNPKKFIKHVDKS